MELYMMVFVLRMLKWKSAMCLECDIPQVRRCQQGGPRIDCMVVCMQWEWYLGLAKMKESVTKCTKWSVWAVGNLNHLDSWCLNMESKWGKERRPSEPSWKLESFFLCSCWGLLVTPHLIFKAIKMKGWKLTWHELKAEIVLQLSCQRGPEFVPCTQCIDITWQS